MNGEFPSYDAITTEDDDATPDPPLATLVARQLLSPTPPVVPWNQATLQEVKSARGALVATQDEARRFRSRVEWLQAEMEAAWLAK